MTSQQKIETDRAHVGDAKKFQGLLDRESLRSHEGVKYFRDTLRPHFIKGAQSVFLWRSY